MSDSDAELVVANEIPSITVDGEDALKLIAEVHVLAESLIDSGVISREGFRTAVPETADDLVAMTLVALQAINVTIALERELDMRRQVAWRLRFTADFDQAVSGDEEE